MSGSERTGVIERPGRRLAWRAVGSGPPIVLVNGYAASAADWDPTFVAGLAGAFEVICPDNRGVGDSQLGDPDEPVTVDGMARDVEAMLDALDIDRAPVVGWSMGGFVAQRLALRAPGRVGALVLLATDPGGSTAVLPDPAVWARLVDHSGTAREQASRLIALLFPSDVVPEIDREFGDAVADARASLSSSALRAQEEAMVAWHAGEQPRPEGDSPRTLIACGDEDQVIPPANADVLAARWPDSRVERFAQAGHAFMAQVPGQLADLIRAFLAT